MPSHGYALASFAFPSSPTWKGLRWLSKVLNCCQRTGLYFFSCTSISSCGFRGTYQNSKSEKTPNPYTLGHRWALPALSAIAQFSFEPKSEYTNTPSILASELSLLVLFKRAESSVSWAYPCRRVWGVVRTASASPLAHSAVHHFRRLKYQYESYASSRDAPTLPQQWWCKLLRR